MGGETGSTSVLGVTPDGSIKVSVIGTVIVGGTVNASGSVVTLQGTSPWVVGSVVGTYAEDAASASGDKGLLVLGARNDTLSSVTSADLDYSTFSTGPSGEIIVANAPLTKWVQGNASCFTGVAQPIIAAQGASIFSYITAIQVANASANNAYLTFLSGSSVIGYTTAPANGGSNIVLPNALKTFANANFAASVSGVASVFLAAEGFISKT